MLSLKAPVPRYRELHLQRFGATLRVHVSRQSLDWKATRHDLRSTDAHPARRVLNLSLASCKSSGARAPAPPARPGWVDTSRRQYASMKQKRQELDQQTPSVAIDAGKETYRQEAPSRQTPLWIGRRNNTTASALCFRTTSSAPPQAPGAPNSPMFRLVGWVDPM